MRNVGQILCILGVVLGVYALFFMDVSVPTGDGNRVVNINLLSERQNYILISGVLFIAGIVASSLRNNGVVNNVDYTRLSSMKGSDFFSSDKDSYVLNEMEINNLSLMLLAKYPKNSISEILLMSLPTIDIFVSDIPADLKEKFRAMLLDRMKQNT